MGCGYTVVVVDSSKEQQIVDDEWCHGYGPALGERAGWASAFVAWLEMIVAAEKKGVDSLRAATATRHEWMRMSSSLEDSKRDKRGDIVETQSDGPLLQSWSCDGRGIRGFCFVSKSPDRTRPSSL